jgi:DMSO/TMAO reductase YedYZ heme-binding membrane subunit
MKDTRFAQFAIFVNSAVPISLLGWDWYHHHLGANPTEFATRTTGVLTLLFLILSLAVTARKALGLPDDKVPAAARFYGFFYGCTTCLRMSGSDKLLRHRAHRRRHRKRPI